MAEQPTRGGTDGAWSGPPAGRAADEVTDVTQDAEPSVESDIEAAPGRLSRRTVALLALVVLVPLTSAIAVALLLSAGTGQTLGGAGETPTARMDGAAAADGDTGTDGTSDPMKAASTPAGHVERVGRDDAADALRTAGVRRLGAVVAAWTWDDGDSTTLVAVTRRVTRRNPDLSPRAVTLRATTVADPGGRATLLATSVDVGPACARGVEMTMDVTGDVVVRDLDGDGRREAVLVWSRGCGDRTSLRTTVLAGTAAYVLAGQGSVLAEPDPPRADWPAGFLDAASAALDSARRPGAGPR